MPARSISERGLSAEMIPIGIESVSQKIAPPKTSAAVTGAARRTMSFTSCAVDERGPSDCSPTSCQRKRPYCCQTGSSRWRRSATRCTSSGVAPCPAASRAGSAGVM